jgi:energy-coupling factor transport system ATP-binding protein
MIQLSNITYTYPAVQESSLQEISLTIPEGQFCAVVGANGAGKSTLAYTIAGFIPHFFHGELQGKVVVAGKDTSSTPLYELVSEVGLIFQNPFNQISSTKYTVREEIAFGLENLGISRPEMLDRIEAVMGLVGISSLAERSPLALSGGQMQRVAIASVLAMQPRILVLDEPTSQLDPIGSREVFSAVRALSQSGSMTVVMIEHKLEWVATFADRVIVLAGGHLVADGPADEILTADVMLQNRIGQTRYTQAARMAVRQGLRPRDRALPVTLDQASIDFAET